MTNEIPRQDTHRGLSRRQILGGVGATASLALAGCSRSSREASTGERESSALARLRDRFRRPSLAGSKASFASLYGPLPNEKFPVPALPEGAIEERYYRQRVNYHTRETPGSLVVDTRNFYLYLVEPDGKAMRYGVGLGKAGFEWSGRARVLWKQKWPKWTPPEEMIERRPELAKWSEENGGMPGGPDNPLGARALYIFEGNVDTLYRLHGTPEYNSIGKAVSSGCVRMVHQDVIDLYDRVKTRAPILVT